MKMCDECGSNQANVYLTQIINNDTSVMNLCEECARKKGINIALAEAGPKSTEEDERLKNLSCSRCGLPYLEFKSKGLLGCSGCYTSFEPQINEYLMRVHGSSVHRGKRYSRQEPLRLRESDLLHLKQELDSAIKNEKFELAAEIRDAIYKLNGK